MTKNKNKNSSSKAKRVSEGYGGGDVPRRAIRTYHTMSIRPPPVTEECVVRAVAQGTITSQATAATQTNYNFQLANANVGAGFFDQYKIEAIRFTIAPQNNAIGLVTNSTTTLVPLYCVIDYDDNSNLGSAAAAEAYSTCVVLHPGESCERTFQPRMALGAYSGAFTSYANVAPQWIDAASTTVQHYGIKTFVPGAAASQTTLQAWDIIVEYFIRFRKSI